MADENSTFILGINDTHDGNNSTGPSGFENSTLKAVHDSLAVVILVIIMLAMGADISWHDVWSHIRRPVSLIIGMGCQFIMMPLAGFILIKAFSIKGLLATGVLLVACSAGGVTSNIFTYFAEGDVSLSITMTAFSTVVALGMMPLNMWMYGRSLDTGDIVIPYVRIIVSLISITTPVAVGILIHWKLPKVAPYVTKAGSWAGVAFIVIAQTMEIFIFPDIFTDIPWQLFAAVTILPAIGLSFGYGLAWVLKRPPAVRRTIAIESGIQNVGISITITVLSFSFEHQKRVMAFPWLYAFTMIIMCVVMTTVFRIAKRFCGLTDPVEPKVNEKTMENEIYVIGGKEVENGSESIATISFTSKPS